MADQIAVEHALAIIRGQFVPSRPVRLPVSDGLLNCATVCDVVAPYDTPRFDCSAMDGFAVRSSEARSASPIDPARFDIICDIPAQGEVGLIAPGQAAGISTGAPLPQGTDAVIAHENTGSQGSTLLVTAPVAPDLNVRRRGEDLERGSLVVPAGVALTADMIGAMLACGVQQIEVRRLPRIRIVPTGSEFANSMGSAQGPRFDSNGPMIATACRSLGIETNLECSTPDEEQLLYERLLLPGGEDGSDILITIGGVSAGRHDLIPRLLENGGAKILFQGVAMRPGKPILFAILPDGRPFFGLPGNPVAALVAFRFFVMDGIRRFMGLAREQGRAVSISAQARKDVTRFMRGRTTPEKDSVELLMDQRSHVMLSVLEADCWLKIDPGEASIRAWCYDKQPHLR